MTTSVSAIGAPLMQSPRRRVKSDRMTTFFLLKRHSGVGRESGGRMKRTSQREQAAAFGRLHREPGILVLPNAWDVITARVIETAGFSAIATSSAGVAWALGYVDGERISRGEMLAVVPRTASRVGGPRTADLEAGDGTAPGAAAETAPGGRAAGRRGAGPPGR